MREEGEEGGRGGGGGGGGGHAAGWVVSLPVLSWSWVGCEAQCRTQNQQQDSSSSTGLHSICRAATQGGC